MTTDRNTLMVASLALEPGWVMLTYQPVEIIRLGRALERTDESGQRKNNSC